MTQPQSTVDRFISLVSASANTLTADEYAERDRLYRKFEAVDELYEACHAVAEATITMEQIAAMNLVVAVLNRIDHPPTAD